MPHCCDSFQLFTLSAGDVSSAFRPSSMEPGDRLVSTFNIRPKTLLFDEALVFPVLSPSPHPAPPSRKPPLPAGGLFPVKMEFILSTLTSVARLIVVFSVLL